MTALKAMTIWPAYQHFEENRKGSITLGKVADFVILSGDPTAIDPETLDTLKVLETVKEGETIFTRAADGDASGKQGALQPMPNVGGDTFGNFLRHASHEVEEAGGHAHGPDVYFTALARGLARHGE